MTSPDALTRLGYYSISSEPTLVWNGSLRWTGADSSDATGLPYRATIMSLLSEPSAFKLTVNSVDLTAPMGMIDLDIEVMEDGIDISDMVLRIVVLEDAVSYGGGFFDDVTRHMSPDVPVTVNELGQVQNVFQLLDIAFGSVHENLEVIAFLQDDSTKKLHAAVSSLPTPDYSMRYYALGKRQLDGPSSGFHYFDFFRIYNTGNLTDTFTVDMTGSYTDGWSVGICDESSCYGPTWSAELAPGEFKELHAMVLPFSPGYAALTVEMSQSQVTYDFPRVLEYNYVTNDVDVLIVDDDGAADYEDFLLDALSGSTYTYGLWNRRANDPGATTLNNYPAVVWSTGLEYPTLDAEDREALGAYLDSGGALFITGQDIGGDMVDQGSLAYQWYEDYLHATFFIDISDDHTLDGVPGDPISHGLDLTITGGDGANNQELPDSIGPADELATVIWKYDATRNGAIRADAGTYKVVYLGFGYEGIDNALDRQDVLLNSLEWMLLPPTPAGRVPSDTPLVLDRLPGGENLLLTWGESCLSSDVDYAVYVGTLGDFDSHVPVTCSSGGGTELTVAVESGDEYYLVVPSNESLEGSYGKSSSGVERPPSAEACLNQGIGECP